ncbi:potassium transporter [Solibacillus sp. CAU 1738]|uniref:potassium transporter n=1 Tax=Solibacillus sp. CAU 1738 TaxID=3140363 RepID=UPI0032613F34
MNKISSSKNSTTLLLSALIIALLFAVYYYVVMPKQNEVSAMQSSVSNLQSDVSGLQNQITAVSSEQEKGTPNQFALRKKVPQDRNLVELLLNLEEIEFVSDSRVLAIKFNNYDSLVAESQLQDPNQEESTEDASQSTTENTDTVAVSAQTNDQQTTSGALPVSSIAKESLPAELKMLTFSIDVEGPNAAKLEQFLKELETLERVMHVDMVDFALPGEENAFAEERSEGVAATIQVTTFYYEGNQ